MAGHAPRDAARGSHGRARDRAPLLRPALVARLLREGARHSLRAAGRGRGRGAARVGRGRLQLPLARDRRGAPVERRRPSRAARAWLRAAAARGDRRRGTELPGAGRLPRGACRQRRRPSSLPQPRLRRARPSPRLLRPRPGRHRDGAPPGPLVTAASAVDLEVTIGAVRLPNPVIAAAGTFGYGTEFAGLVDVSMIAALAAIVRAVRPRVRLPLWVKLSPNVGDVTVVGRAAEAEGADALSAINTLRGLAIDLDGRRPRLASGSGGLSGPAIKPVALYMVRALAQAVRIPV